MQEDTGDRVLSVIRAVLIRWTAHYLAYCRLLALAPILKALVQRVSLRTAADNQLITGDKKAKAKARQMIAIIDNSLFWNAITRFTIFLMLSIISKL
ncbi:hypothetical protein B0H13DRAFT_1604906 [Mycena leptocephala]|nr:hypothetical protein B0H13DRAFT_1604906 [Mycena leptocephala]